MKLSKETLNMLSELHEIKELAKKLTNQLDVKLKEETNNILGICTHVHETQLFQNTDNHIATLEAIADLADAGTVSGRWEDEDAHQECYNLRISHIPYVIVTRTE